MTGATLQLDDLHSLLSNRATRHVLDTKDYGPNHYDPEATVTLYQLIPLQQHDRPWIVRVELHTTGDETTTDFDSWGEAETAYAREVDRLGDWDDYDDDED